MNQHIIFKSPVLKGSYKKFLKVLLPIRSTTYENAMRILNTSPYREKAKSCTKVLLNFKNHIAQINGSMLNKIEKVLISEAWTANARQLKRIHIMGKQHTGIMHKPYTRIFIKFSY